MIPWFWLGYQLYCCNTGSSHTTSHVPFWNQYTCLFSWLKNEHQQCVFHQIFHFSSETISWLTDDLNQQFFFIKMPNIPQFVLLKCVCCFTSFYCTCLVKLIMLHCYKQNKWFDDVTFASGKLWWVVFQNNFFRPND